jgi:hypothetical protein
MLRLVRTFWVCLLVLALPLQGLAAAAMALCEWQSGLPTLAAATVAPPCHSEAGHALATDVTSAEADDTATPVHPCSHCSTCCVVAGPTPRLWNLPQPLPTSEAFLHWVAQAGEFAVAGPERPPRSPRA